MRLINKRIHIIKSRQLTINYVAVFALTAAVICGCTSTEQAVPGTGLSENAYEIDGKVYHPIDSANGFRQQGVASWYGKKFHGRRTSNGEVYDMYAMTAAHKTLPLGTWVRVRRLASSV